MSGTRSLNWLDRNGVSSASLCRGSAAVVLGMLIAFATVILSRRLAGALESPLGSVALLAAGTLTASAAAAVRLGWLLARAALPTPRLDRVVMFMALLSVLALGAGLCVPGTSTIGKILVFTLLAAEEGWAWAWYLGRRDFRRAMSNSPAPSRGMGCQSPLGHSQSGDLPHMGLLPKEVVQQLTRSQAADGSESLAGWVRLPFAAGQRTGSIHVAFCPPLCATPELLVEQVDGPAARVKTAQLLPYGARLDLKLAVAAAEPATVLLQFTARAAREKRPADQM